MQERANALTADPATHFGGINWLNTTVTGDPQGATYIMRSSLRGQGDRLRLETRLFNPQGHTVWSHKSDGSLADSFDWQDRVAETIAATGSNMILETETLKIAALPDESLQPEQCMLMGMMVWRSYSPDAFVASAKLQARAIAAKPDMADACAEAISCVVAVAQLVSTRGRNPLWRYYRNG